MFVSGKFIQASLLLGPRLPCKYFRSPKKLADVKRSSLLVANRQCRRKKRFKKSAAGGRSQFGVDGINPFPRQNKLDRLGLEIISIHSILPPWSKLWSAAEKPKHSSLFTPTVVTKRPNKLECLSPASLSSFV